ncbi:GNAT family N-acetyltransferase [Paracraurococcus ruber]|uniref:N-acetyltransferase domain-containing protein n=1 Tax=Paracraurococcus ruber TaxID=77675 RepID=A0ABS1CR66_9PROT|nr:GNAT family protein [Paracraurococcus ruber]MBK1656920.1 hypothetical protein [Paracraurococcus ruber]TDG33289.1 N-acetyltransferase [Paracraurococcus ruber]
MIGAAASAPRDAAPAWPQAGDPVDATPRPRPGRQVLAGRSVTLEPLRAEHAAALWQPASDAPDSWAWLPHGPFARQAAFAGLVRLMAASEDEIVWAVRPHDRQGVAGAPAGWIALLDIRPGDAAIELGNVWFPPGLARTRAATEAMFLLLRQAFDLGYLRVGWKCNALNLASRRAAERLGFRLEGILRAHMIIRGHRRDTAYFGLLASEWPLRRAAIATWLEDGNFDPAGQAIARLQR